MSENRVQINPCLVLASKGKMVKKIAVVRHILLICSLIQLQYKKVLNSAIKWTLFDETIVTVAKTSSHDFSYQRHFHTNH